MASPSVSSSSTQLTQSTKATTVSSKSKRSSAYDTNFEQHLIDHNIFPPFYKLPDGRMVPKPANFEEIRQAIRAPRASLSPSIIPEPAFENFQLRSTTKSEGTVMRSIIPGLAGDLDIPNEGHLPFTNLDSITDNTTVNPIPDFFDGALPGAVDKQVRDDLNNIIIPTKHATVPVAPNLFLEAKGPGGTGDVALRQAILNGGHGTIMMHTLDNYLIEQPVYNGNAYTFTATLVDGTLKLYAHHLAPPSRPEQRPAIYTTQLKAYALTGDRDVWLEGTAAFRTLRVVAKRYRDQFIEAANARARKQNVEPAATQDNLPTSTIEEQQEGGSSPANFFDCLPFAESQDEDQQTQETQETQETNVGLAILHQEYDKDDANENEASMGFATSFTSSFTSTSREDPLRSQRQPKLPRTPPSPSSTRAKKR